MDPGNTVTELYSYSAARPLNGTGQDATQTQPRRVNFTEEASPDFQVELNDAHDHRPRVFAITWVLVGSSLTVLAIIAAVL